MCRKLIRPLFAIILITVLGRPGAAQDNRSNVGRQDRPSVIACDGDYQHHLQGICRDSQGNLFWSFTTALVKTDHAGHRLKQTPVDNHHGDLCFHNDKIYVAVNLGRFNDPQGNADSWVYEYRANDLSLVAKHETQQVFHGAGGIAFHAGKFLVVGGLPDDVYENYVYEYDTDFRFVAKRTIASGHTRLGIQTAAFADGHWWFGCYGTRLLKVDPQFRLIGNYLFDAGLGILGNPDGSFLVARGPRTADSRCTGQALMAFAHRQLGLSFRKPITKLLFGSCIKQEKPMPLLKTIIAQKPELFLMLGDNIYADTTDMKVMRAKYAKLRSNEDFAKLLELCPVLATWDDHDYGVNDGGASYPQREASQQLFVDFWGDTADSPRRSRAGVYDGTIIGPPGKRLQIILLDTRYFRGPLQKGTKRTGGPYLPSDDASIPMLGEPQWKWLEEQLRRPAEVRLIVSSIQCVSTAAGQETWSNLPHERRRLFELLGKTKANGVVIISGDRHWSELSVEKGLAPYPVYDLTSSSLNQIHSRGTPTENTNRDLATTFHRENFGAIQIDWEAADPRLILQIIDIKGSVVLQKTLQLSQLRGRP
jgi:alkaline phosphatase D